MLVTELSSEAFSNAISYADQVGIDMAAFAESENQVKDFEEFCIENDVQFNKNGTPE